MAIFASIFAYVGRFLGRVRDLQDRWADAVYEKGLIPFAVDGDGDPLDTEELPGEVRRILRTEGRG